MNQVQQQLETLIASGEVRTEWVDIDTVRESAKNPRYISNEQLAELKKSITAFPQMMALRPGVVDGTGELMGGNQRHKACKELGWHKFPVIRAGNLTPEQLKEFIIKDNLPFGEWDTKMLKEDWNIEELGEWGMDITELVKKAALPGNIVFSQEIDQVSNYVVLRFDKDIDWLQICTMLGLQTVHARRQNGKPWAKGVGRVVDGVKAIQLIQKSGSEL